MYNFAPVGALPQASGKVARLVNQLRIQGITDPNVLGVIESIPREVFIPEMFHNQAYDDIALPIGRGQTISQPCVVAIMTQALKISDRDKVLEIGTGSGYQAAILARLCRRLYTIERHRPLLQRAQEIFDELRLRNITAICADGMKGWPVINGISQAPFQKIMVTAASRHRPPQELLDQLDVGGIMVCPVGSNLDEQVLRKYTKMSDDTFSMHDICPVRFVPLLPDIARANEAAESDALCPA